LPSPPANKKLLRQSLPRRPNVFQNERSDVLEPHGSASIAALAGGEIEANRQVCPTIVGSGAKLHPAEASMQIQLDKMLSWSRLVLPTNDNDVTSFKPEPRN
jgi:hypothetical protein